MSKEFQNISNFSETQEIDKGCFVTKLVKVPHKLTNNNIT